ARLRGAGRPPPTPAASASSRRPAWPWRLAAGLCAAAIGPEDLEFGDDALSELVAWTRECECCVCVQALEGAGPAGAADAELERCAPVAAGLAGGEIAAKRALLAVGAGAARGQRVVDPRGRAPALDPAGGFEPGDRGHEVTARQVVRGREGLAIRVVGALLRHRRPTERTAHDDSAKRARLTSDLASDDGAVCVSVHGGPSCWP